MVLLLRRAPLPTAAAATALAAGRQGPVTLMLALSTPACLAASEHINPSIKKDIEKVRGGPAVHSWEAAAGLGAVLARIMCVCECRPRCSRDQRALSCGCTAGGGHRGGAR